MSNWTLTTNVLDCSSCGGEHDQITYESTDRWRYAAVCPVTGEAMAAIEYGQEHHPSAVKLTLTPDEARALWLDANDFAQESPDAFLSALDQLYSRMVDADVDVEPVLPDLDEREGESAVRERLEASRRQAEQAGALLVQAREQRAFGS